MNSKFGTQKKVSSQTKVCGYAERFIIDEPECHPARFLLLQILVHNYAAGIQLLVHQPPCLSDTLVVALEQQCFPKPAPAQSVNKQYT